MYIIVIYHPIDPLQRYLDDNANYIQNPTLNEIGDEDVNTGPEVCLIPKMAQSSAYLILV